MSFVALLFLFNNVVTSVDIRGGYADVNFATQVGQPLNTDKINEDVRQLWNTGRFEDIRVETVQREEGTAVMFNVVPSPSVRLHDVRIEPPSYAIHVKPPEGTMLNRARAQALAAEARSQLEQHGYMDPRVDYEFVPYAKDVADLKLTVHAADPVRVREVRIDSEARPQLHALRGRRMFFWKLAPSYSEQAVASDRGRILSSYLAKGYFDARVTSETKFHADGATVNFAIDPGPHYEVRNPISCSDLLTERRAAQKHGVLDFSVRSELQDGQLKTTVDRGPAFYVGRINFSGNHHFGDLTMRRNFVLEEAEPFDEYKLRQSIARLNRTSIFEPVDVKDVVISPHELTGVADVNVRLTERRRGKWSLSGPVGPVSIGGPLQGSVSSRTPLLSTFTASISVVALAKPIVPIIPVKSFIPVAALERPFDPGRGWLSGFTIAPQLGWQMTAITYAATQLRQRLGPKLAGDRGLIPDLPVTIATRTGEKTMLCEAPPPRLAVLRTAVAFGLQVLSSLPML